MLHNLISDLYSDAYIYNTRLVRHIVSVAQSVKPVCTASACCNNDAACFNAEFFFAVRCNNSRASAVLNYYIYTFTAEHNLNAVCLQVFFDCFIYVLSFLCAEMSDRTVYKLESRFDCTFSDCFYLFFVADALYLAVSAKVEIYFICIVNSFLRIVFADKLRQISSDLIA